MTEDYLRLTREGYDATAAAYAERFHHHLDGKPFELGMLDAFGALVGSGGRVADVGCGTGATTARLARLGCDVVGIDLSEGMLREARRLNPHLEFRAGSMSALDFTDGACAGVCAWYSTIHIPDEQLPAVFAEFRRVLAAGGHLLLAFQVGEQPLILTEAFGARIEVTYHRRRPADVLATLRRSGFAEVATLVRQPDGDGIESTPQAVLVARRS